MSRYRLLPSPAQEVVLRDHCAQARFVWNLAVEQHRHWRSGRKSGPGYLEQSRQLTAARAEHPWLAAGSQMWAEKASRDIARRFDVIRVEDLKIGNMTRSAKGTAGNLRQKSGLNRAILAQGWGLLVRRLADKAPGRVEKVNPQFTSQGCSVCGHVDPKSRESQARFVCTACHFTGHADVNAARNIAAGHAVTARGGDGEARPVNREPQLLLQSA